MNHDDVNEIVKMDSEDVVFESRSMSYIYPWEAHKEPSPPLSNLISEGGGLGRMLTGGTPLAPTALAEMVVYSNPNDNILTTNSRTDSLTSAHPLVFFL